jgi:hypothetical protein
MTYRPQESVFGPPFVARVPSLVYLLAALVVLGLVFLGERAESGTWLFHYVVEEDVRRVMSIRTFSVVLLVSSLASVFRAGMRGVRIYPDGIESRDVLNFIVPRLKRYRWPQIERIILDASQIGFDLWDGSRAYLPHVSDRDTLAATLEHIAAARAIPVRGGTFDPDEFDDEADEQTRNDG